MDEMPVVSPCVSVCRLDEQDICVGCYRSLLEITAWIACTDQEKREILRCCEERQRARKAARGK